MTLAEIAADQRARHEGEGEWDFVRAVIEAFEADPEFRLPERLGAFVKELDGVQAASDLDSGPSSGPPKAWPLMMAGDVARRLRELLNPPAEEDEPVRIPGRKCSVDPDDEEDP